MHSSRMSTARLLTESRSIPCIFGCLHRGGLYPGSRPPGSAYGGWELGRPPFPVNRQTGVKTLPCPKLRLRVVKSKDHAYFTKFIMWAKLNSTYFYVSTKNDARFRDIAKHTSPERINLSPRTTIATHSICISQGNTSSTSAYISSRMMRNYLLPKRNVVGIIYCKLYVLQVRPEIK